MKQKKFTFKTEKATGKYRSFFPDHHIIKFDKKEIGTISDEAPWKINLRVMKVDTDEKLNCPWKMVRLKHESKTLQEQKDWLNSNIELILSKWELYPLD